MALRDPNENFLDGLLAEMSTSIVSTEKMGIVDFAHDILFNGDSDWQLYPTQRAILKAFYKEPLTIEESKILEEWLAEDRTTWVPERRYIALVLEAGRRGSKALTLTTLIRTPNGLKTFGEIKPGDYVFNHQGEPVKVLAETPVYTNHKIYRLYFSDNSTIDCDAEHLWRTWDKSARKAYGRAKNPTKHPKIRTTQEIVDSLYIKRKDGKLENNHSIELAEPLKYPEQELPINPYVLGIFLGDGYYKTGMITSSKEDIEWLKTKFNNLGYDTYDTPTTSYPYRFSSKRLTKELKEIGLLNNKNKKVPDIYLTSSINQRLALLQGLMDTDGAVDTRGHTSFCNTNFNLTNTVFELAISLGCIATRSTYQGKYYDKETKLYEEIRLRPKLCPVSLPRKVARYKACTAQNNKRFITYAEEIASTPVKCITVEGGYFLVGNNIITHNCNVSTANIPTTVGDITYGELNKRLNKGERIGIMTYDFSQAITKSYITYDIKSEVNAIEPCYRVKTLTSRIEECNAEHPFLRWNRELNKPEWVKLKDLKRGDYIAVSDGLDIWGPNDISDKDLDAISILLTLLPNDPTNKAETTFNLPTYKSNYYSYLTEFLSKHYPNCWFIQTKTFHLPNNKKNKLRLFYNSISSIVKTLNKESSIKLLKKIYKIRGSLFNKNNKGLVFICNQKDNLIYNILVKLKCAPEIKKFDGNYSGNVIVISNYLKVLSLVNYLDITPEEKITLNSLKEEFCGVSTYPVGTERKGYIPLKEYAKIKEEIIREGDPYKIDQLTNNVEWERIKSIKPIGDRETIALEVKGTNVIGNNIISHNSTLASIICLKEFYDLITLPSPQRTWGLLPASPIAILVMAQSQAQVKETIFAAIRGYAEESAFFSGLKQAGAIDILAEEIRCPAKNVAIYAKHTNSKSLVGYSLKCMLLDEVARFETTGEEGKNKAEEIWRNVGAGGAAFGTSFKKVAISSAWEPGDPIEKFYNDAHNDPNTLGFKLTTFQLNLALKKGVTPVIVSDYATDYIKARREYEGVRFNKFNTFIDYVNLERAMTGVTTIDSQPCKLDVTSKAGTRHYAGVNILRIALRKSVEELQFMHIDPALKKDSAALAMAHAEQRAEDKKWVIVVDTLIKWEPHTDNNGLKRIVSYLDIEQKLDDIHEVRPLYRVTFDSWNSAGFIQKLHSKGIDSEQVSCSREAQFTYFTLFRDLLAHNYIVLPRDTLWSNDAITELSELVLKPNRQIIHPYAGKDLADAIVNVVYQVHQYMIMSGLNFTMGLSPGIVDNPTLRTISTLHTNNGLNIGQARDNLYNIRRYS